MQTTELSLPKHWACYFVNGDKCGLDRENIKAIEAFEKSMVATYGSCWCVSVADEDSEGDLGFLRYHDADEFFPFATDCYLYTFDTTPRE